MGAEEILLVMNTGKKSVNSLKLTIYPVILLVYIVLKYFVQMHYLLLAYLLNNLYSPVTPQVLLCLNDFERILIQRAKTFHVVVKMSSVAGRKQPNNAMNQKVIGRAFYLPLPLEETLKNDQFLTKL